MVKAIVLGGYGINCEEETAFALAKAGAQPEIVHVNDLISGKRKLDDYRILAFPGGFSYGDDTGSGNAFANRLRNNLWDSVRKFAEGDNLILGVCNGFQILVNLGLLPALGGSFERKAALLYNDNARYTARWVDLKAQGSASPWLKGIGGLSLPIAHGEGKFYAPEGVLRELNEKKRIAFRYVKGEICESQGLPYNPNGALEDIAGITDETGRIMGMMPHPERAIAFTHLPHWPVLKEKLKAEGKPLPEDGPGLALFRNAVAYF